MTHLVECTIFHEKYFLQFHFYPSDGNKSPLDKNGNWKATTKH